LHRRAFRRKGINIMTHRIRTKRVILSLALTIALVLSGLPGLIADGGPAGMGADIFSAAAEGDVALVDIATAEVSAIAPQIYTGKALKPEPVVNIGGVILEPDVDYTLSYKSNKLPGTATITIKGESSMGYTGKKVMNFNIIIEAPANLKAKTTGKDIRSITFSWKKSKNVTGYKIYYASNKDFTKQKKGKALKGDDVTSYSIEHPYYKRNYYIKMRSYRTINGEDY
jgi:hypothetical protein